jgi:hypothetical protein
MFEFRISQTMRVLSSFLGWASKLDLRDRKGLENEDGQETNTVSQLRSCRNCQE